MTQNNYQKELRIAKGIALMTWQTIAHLYDERLDVDIKGDGSPVTIADKTANKLIIEGLRKFFPEDRIVSEEDKNIILGKRTWYIDPIDGTQGFIKRNGRNA